MLHNGKLPRSKLFQCFLQSLNATSATRTPFSKVVHGAAGARLASVGWRVKYFLSCFLISPNNALTTINDLMFYCLVVSCTPSLCLFVSICNSLSHPSILCEPIISLPHSVGVLTTAWGPVFLKCTLYIYVWSNLYICFNIWGELFIGCVEKLCNCFTLHPDSTEASLYICHRTWPLSAHMDFTHSSSFTR